MPCMACTLACFVHTAPLASVSRIHTMVIRRAEGQLQKRNIASCRMHDRYMHPSSTELSRLRSRPRTAMVINLAVSMLLLARIPCDNIFAAGERGTCYIN